MYCNNDLNTNNTLGGSSREHSSAGGSEGAERPLVTNTESYSPFRHLNALQAPSHKAYSVLSPSSKRYVLQSVIKDILTGVGESRNGTKDKFYRFLACKQLSAAFRPDSPKHGDYELLKQWEGEISIAKVGYTYTEEAGIRGTFTGMCRCDSLWVCPVCQPVISEYRALEIRKALYDHKKNGGTIVFVTATTKHKRTDTLKDTLSAVSESMSYVKNGKSWQTFKFDNGFVGSIRTLEHTFTDRNGHHPHLHELWFFDEPVNPKLLKSWIWTRYTKALNKRGYTCSRTRGIDVKVCLTDKEQESKIQGLNITEIESIASYWAKGMNVDQTFSEFSSSCAWGVAEELTKHHLKTPRTYNDGTEVVSYNATAFALHYMDTLSQISVCKDRDVKKVLFRKATRFKKLFIDYAEATFGRSQLFWSKGLKDRFSIEELKDSEVGEQLESLVIELNSLSIEDLQKIVKLRLRPAIISIVENPDYKDDEVRAAKVREFIDNQNRRIMRFG